MSIPDPMPCLLAPEPCRSPMTCQHLTYCREQDLRSAREYNEGLAACRERGITDPFRAREG